MWAHGPNELTYSRLSTSVAVDVSLSALLALNEDNFEVSDSVPDCIPGVDMYHSLNSKNRW